MPQTYPNNYIQPWQCHKSGVKWNKVTNSILLNYRKRQEGVHFTQKHICKTAQFRRTISVLASFHDVCVYMSRSKKSIDETLQIYVCTAEERESWLLQPYTGKLFQRYTVILVRSCMSTFMRSLIYFSSFSLITSSSKDGTSRLALSKDFILKLILVQYTIYASLYFQRSQINTR